ncbi:MAG: MFS transporter [Propionibacteriaceae bacterium]|nr:MFS transporter [Propionibacteriaceae bacterium]
MSSTRSLGALILSNVFGGVGVASGIAVGALLTASLGGTALAGVGQALGVFGAGLLAVPLATLATRRGRGSALAIGYAAAASGALIVLVASWLGSLALLFVGLLLFGAAQAANLQTRYAASELVDPARRGRTMSVVVWATTIGSVVGPNLSAAGATLGRPLGLPDLAGPYLFSVTAFVVAGLSAALLYRRPAGSSAPTQTGRRPRGALAALGWAFRHPVARFAVVLLITAHAVMVGLMSMTPVHLGGHGQHLTVIGFVISLHILGMYALSPVFGWLADRIGPMRTALLGLATLGAAALTAFAGQDHLTLVMVALVLLGLGWSASTIAASVLLAGVDAGDVRVPLQGATDALMSYGGAAAALLSGPVLVLIGYGGLALSALALLAPAVVLLWVGRTRSSA